ncbi:hypothetical protein JX265_003513 [Neoarthrinium moseri]|uniref:Uncharacterized protein n=1 Tax=Neoarthrinium moseri TaxID=1658444 RepID=A0A9Q0ASA6_9PEZI|nr:hypothetical protein JX265_003513 [Neoarthrinium moseri]
MVAFKKLFLALTSFTAAVRATPLPSDSPPDYDNSLAGRDAPTGSTSQLEARVEPSMAIHWSSDGRIVVLTGAALTVQLLQSFNRVGNQAELPRALTRDLTGWLRHYNGVISNAAVQALGIRKRQIYWARGQRATDFGFTFQLPNHVLGQLAGVIRILQEWMSSKGQAFTTQEHSPGFADDAMNNKYKRDELETRDNCPTSLTVWNLAITAPSDPQWKSFKGGDDCE